MRATALLASLLSVAPAAAAPLPGDPAVAIVDPARGLLVRWSMPPGPLPAGGFRVDRSVDGGAARTLATLRASSPDEGAGASAALARHFMELEADPAAATDPRKRKELASTHFALEVLSFADLGLARALGLAFVDASAPAGATVRYTVTALGLGGRAEVPWADTGPVAVRPTPLPGTPVALAAVSVRGAVELVWDAAPGDAGRPGGAATFQVLRRPAAGGPLQPVGKGPVLKRLRAGPKAPRPPDLRDAAAPTEERLVYVVRGLDLFGRPGPDSAPVEVFHADHAANDPPGRVAVAGEPGRLVISWEAAPNPHTAGFLVRRSLASDGPWDTLTPRPVAGRAFADGSGVPGSAYSYQVAAVNPRGEAGAWTPAVRAVLRAAAAPDPPTGLTAERLTGRVVLRWTPGGGAPARGFRVERDAGGGVFAILRDDLAVEPLFEDRLPPDALGTMTYRVAAVGLDGQVSAPSAALAVPLPLTRAPARPEVTGISGAGGRVALTWRATGERGEAAGFLVLRSTGRSDEGDVITPAPLPAGATSFTDGQVVAGSTYRYRVVAVDSAGNRSHPSFSVAVRVGDPALPVPPAPRLRFQATPFPRVVAEFEPPASASVRWVLERRDAEGRWIAVTGAIPAGTRSAIDAHAPHGRNAYRLTATATSGASGPSSAPAAVEVP